MDNEILESRKQLLNVLRNKKLGFGSLHLNKISENKILSMFDCFLESGFCFFEAAPAYNNEYLFAKYLTARYDRNDYLLANKIPIRGSGEYSKTRFMDVFNDSLRECNVKYFDFYLLHNIGRKEYNRFKEIDCFEYLYELKQKGLAKYIGFSFHDTSYVLEDILKKHHNKLDFVQLQINYLDWDNPVIQSRKCLEVAAKYQLPVFAMTPLKGGMLLDIPKEARKILAYVSPGKSIASWAYRYAASLENVVLVLSGMRTIADVTENIGLFSGFELINVAEYEAIDKVCVIIEKKRKVKCTECEYCLKACNQNIPIPELISLLNHKQLVSNLLYERITSDKGKASDCIKCRKCEAACPQKINVCNVLKRAEAKFENNPLRVIKRFIIKALNNLKS